MTNAGVGRYDYRVVEVLKVVDGDTVDLRVDVGFYLTAALRFRILGIDTPERGQEGYAAARDYVLAWLADLDGLVRARTYKADAFGRWLADVYADPPTGERRVLASELLDAGLAKPYHR